MKTKINWIIWLGLVCTAVLLSTFFVRPNMAQAQVFFTTPTPLPDGRIIYTVRSGDTCISISLLSGVSEDTLRSLNNLKSDCLLPEGSQLLLGVATPAPTQTGPTQTPTLLVPSPTAYAGNGEVCLILYNDVNGNAFYDDAEMPMGGGQVSLTDRLGKVSLTGETSADPLKPLCFEELPEGEYNIGVGVPEGYNATTALNHVLLVKAGDQDYMNFGAQISARVEVPAETPEEQRSPLLGILGILVLLVGIGVGVFAFLTNRK